MPLEQWGAMVSRRFGRYLTALFGVGEEGFSMEDDPVGEFLSRKEEGAEQSEDEGAPLPAIANAEQQAVEVGTENVEVQGPAVENQEQGLDGPEKVAVDLVETSLYGNEEPLAQFEAEAGGVAAVTDADSQAPEVEGESGEMAATADAPLQTLEVEGQSAEEADSTQREKATEVGEATDAGLQAPDVESEPVEMAATADAAPQTPEVESQSAEKTDSTQREKAPEDGEGDSLLDVFKDEQLSENTISTLSRELSDVNLYSLLEEMKRIAEKVRKRP